MLGGWQSQRACWTLLEIPRGSSKGDDQGDMTIRRLGVAVFRELEGRVEVATPETLRGLCGNDRAARGGNCRLCQG